MSYTITSESYGRRLPKITATADSTDDLATLGTDWAEGSTCVIGSTTYSLDKVQGWVEPGSGGSDLPAVTSDDNGDVLTVVDGAWDKAAPSGGGGTGLFIVEVDSYQMPTGTLGEIRAGIAAGNIPIGVHRNGGQIEYHPVNMFNDNGPDISAVIRVDSVQYQSTSGADDATWELYD